MRINYPYFPGQLTDGQPGGVEYSITTASTATFPSHPLPLFFFLSFLFSFSFFFFFFSRLRIRSSCVNLTQNDTNKVSLVKT
jgi:hypothetical protein